MVLLTYNSIGVIKLELYKEILINALSKENTRISFPSFDGNVEKLFEKECYQVLVKIKEILNDDEFDDEKCFYKTEKIIREFENLGCTDLIRHDFG